MRLRWPPPGGPKTRGAGKRRSLTQDHNVTLVTPNRSSTSFFESSLGGP